MPYLEVDGYSSYYAGDLSKEGTPVVFCHGSGGGHHHWIYQLKKLSGTINPIAIDLPGHGRSEGSPKNNVDGYSEWLRKFSKAAGIERFVAAGHSLGGAVAMTYALKYAEQTLGLIIVGSGAKLRVLPAFLEKLQQGNIPTELPDYLYSSGTPDELLKRGREEVESTDPSIYLADLNACDRFDIRDELPQIKQSTLIICGDEDQLTPVKYSQYLEDKMPRGKLTVINGAGHMVMLEKPEEVNQAIAKFIEEAF